MKSPKALYLSGFNINIHKCEFGHGNESIDSYADPETAVQQQLRLMQDEMEAYAKGPDPQLGNGPAVHIGIDSEWQYRPDKNDNLVLSYQYYMIADLGELSGIIYPKASNPERRIEFNKFTGLILQQAMQEGLIEAWPRIVYIYAHFLRADMTHFKSFWKMKNDVDGMRGTIASVQSNLTVDFETDKRRYKPKPVVLRDEHRHPRRTFIKFIDTMLLTPGGLGLDEAGKLIGLDKLELPEGYDKSDMARFLAECPVLFSEYAIRDSEVSVRFGLRIRAFVLEELAMKNSPPTIGSLSGSLCRKLIEVEHGGKEGFEKMFGREKQRSRIYWDEQKNRPHQIDDVQLNIYRERHEAFVTRCYHGGRNECYMLGPTDIGVFYDFDLTAAYTTGLLDLRALDYSQAFDSRRIEDFIVGEVCGFAHVAFEFPVGTRFPSLPVYSPTRGLYYPLTGISDCTAPELALAHELGADLKILIGIVFPWVSSDIRIFEPFVARVRQRRGHFKQRAKVFEEKLWKEIGNSAYGKTAQGLRDKSVFDPRTNRGKILPQSLLTNPFFAAHTTGLIRAVVSELIARVPAHRNVISVTTDGFLTDAAESELDLSGPLSRRFQTLQDRLDSNL
jgi:hypothetical protein